jgi:hypothetical protein
MGMHRRLRAHQWRGGRAPGGPTVHATQAAVVSAAEMVLSIRRFVVATLLASSTPLQVVAPVANPTADDAGNCGLFGESNAVPPVPGKLILSCDGDPIVGVLYAVYGQPKGKCGDADFGTGSSGSFEDTNPQCKGKDVVAKFESLCVGKTSCTAACGSTDDPIPCNDFFGAPGAPVDPCPNIAKWAAVVVECPSGWGWWFIMLFCLGTAGYVGGFVVYAHKVHGRPIDASALPHPEFWVEVRSLIEDGIAFAAATALSKTGATTTSSGGSRTQEVSSSNTKADRDDKETTGLLEASNGDIAKDYGSGESDMTGRAASAAVEAANDSEDGDSLVE